jgi:hypothetical protein
MSCYFKQNLRSESSCPGAKHSQVRRTGKEGIKRYLVGGRSDEEKSNRGIETD